MYEAGDGPSSYSASTDFEKFDHASMLDMIQHADPAKVIALAHKLDAVSTKTESIATDLQTHMGKVDWEGKGGDAFRDWGSRVASATLTLSDYSSNASVFMLNAGQVLSDVKRDMPQVPSIAYHTVAAYRANKGLTGHYSDTAGVTTTHLDGTYGPYNPNPTAAQYKAAQTSLENSRSLAVDQMNKLGQAYNMATDVIKTSPEPTFPPTPSTIMPARPKYFDNGSDYVPGVSDSSGGGGGNGGSSKIHLQHISVPVSSDSISGGHVSTTTAASLPTGSVHHVSVPNPPSVNLDSVGTLPVSTPPASPLPLPAGPAGPAMPSAGPGGLPVPLPTVPFPTPGGGLVVSAAGGGRTPDAEAVNAARAAAQREAQELDESLSTNMSGYGLSGGRGVPGAGPSAGRIGALGSEPPPNNITGGRPSQRLSSFEGEENAVPRGNVIGAAGGGPGGVGGGGRSGGAYAPASGNGTGGRSGRGRVVGENFETEDGGSLGIPSTTGPRAGRNFTAGGEGLNRTKGLASDRVVGESAEGERVAPGFGGASSAGAGVQERERGRRKKRRLGRHGRHEHDNQDEPTGSPADPQE